MVTKQFHDQTGFNLKRNENLLTRFVSMKSTRSRSSTGRKVKGKSQKTRSPTPQQRIGHPDDIFPLVLTSATQELFDCRTDEDVTRENPYKLLTKENIIQDIKTRAAVSDFHPVKQPVLDYPEEEMLLVFDSDFTYGQCFYLVLTPEKKNTILKPPEPETVEVSENEVDKTQESKPWISLGSEKEIDEESVKETREKFSRVRQMFGRPVSFSDRNASDAKDGYVEFPSYPCSKFSIKLQQDCGINASPALCSSSAQTNWKTLRNACTQYSPRELSEEEKETILSSESLKNFLITVTPRMIHALQQEEIMNVFVDDWKALETEDGAGDWSGQVAEGLMLYQAFTDQKYTKGKNITSIHWHPTIHGVIAVALTEKMEEALDVSTAFITRPAFIVFFSFSDPSNPKLLLECPDEILEFQFCPSNPNVIVGGCKNGQVVLWDITTYITHLQDNQPSSKISSSNTATFDFAGLNKIPVVRFSAVSVVESSHKAPITDVQWLPPTFQVTSKGIPVENKLKMSAQIVTCSLDCTIMFWDVRPPKPLGQFQSGNKQNVDQKTSITSAVSQTFKHLERTWKPLFKVAVSKIDTSGQYAPLKFSLEHYTGNDDTEKAAENGHREKIPDYNQLTVPSASTVPILEDVNTKFYVGTTEGEIVYTDWTVKEEQFQPLYNVKPLYCFNTHHYLVKTMQRSPFFKDIILTVGSWNFAICQEGVMNGPLVESQHSVEECTTGCWSLSRPAVFFIGKGDGSIEIWNLMENTSQPAHVHQRFTNGKIMSIKPWITSLKQHFLAVGDDLGVLRIFKIPQTLYSPSRNETLSMKKYFEQEKNCLMDYLKRKEQCLKQKAKEEELKKNKEAEEPDKFKRSIEEELKQYNDDMEVMRMESEKTSLSAKKRQVETFQQKEKRKRDLGQATSEKNFVEEEKRILRQKIE